jgi:hypothetical protein
MRTNYGGALDRRAQRSDGTSVDWSTTNADPESEQAVRPSAYSQRVHRAWVRQEARRWTFDMSTASWRAAAARDDLTIVPAFGILRVLVADELAGHNDSAPAQSWHLRVM